MVDVESFGGVTLETTSGGRVIDGWERVNKFPWDDGSGLPGPYSSGLWNNVSTKFAKGLRGRVNVVQTPDKLKNPNTVWYNMEKPVIMKNRELGNVDEIVIHVLEPNSEIRTLGSFEIEELLSWGRDGYWIPKILDFFFED